MSENSAAKIDSNFEALHSTASFYVPGTIRELLERHLTYTPLGCSNSAQANNSLAGLTDAVRKTGVPAPEIDAETVEFAIDHLRIIRQQSNEPFRHACLESLKQILRSFNSYFQQNREMHLEVLQIHMMSSNRTLASAARFEFNQLKNSSSTKLETW